MSFRGVGVVQRVPTHIWPSLLRGSSCILETGGFYFLCIRSAGARWGHWGKGVLGSKRCSSPLLCSSARNFRFSLFQPEGGW